MKVNTISREEFLDFTTEAASEFMTRIAAPEVFLVKRFYPETDVLGLRARCFERGLQTEPSWHPCLDSCPDYHRLHDNYPQAYVKARMHAFYHNGWIRENQSLFYYFGEIFRIKNRLAGFTEQAHISNRPSDGYVARVNLQHYPKGGGYQAEHLDPAGPLAIVQTLVCASQKGKDYMSGGVYARSEPGGEQYFLDDFVSPGDLMVLSPAIPHGVAPVDPEDSYNWRTNDGRWIILPLFVASDYKREDTEKPREIAAL